MTPRRIEIMWLIANGYSYKQITKHIGIAHSTIKNMMMTVRMILGARNTYHAVMLSLKAGYFDNLQTPQDP